MIIMQLNKIFTRYKLRFEVTIPEFFLIVIGVLLLLSIYSLYRDHEQKNLAHDYEFLVAQAQLKIEGMQGVMDCHFVGEEYPHTWRDACVLTAEGVEITK
jgi:hypothetical protein